MNENVKRANRIKIETLIKNLEKRNMNGYYVETAAEAKDKALSMITDDDLVSWGGSATLDELEIKNELKNVLNGTAPTPEESAANRRKAFMADVYLTSTNAITMDGELVNIDKTGNRVAAMCYGPKKVIIIAGVNKITSNEDAALQRVKNEACTANAIRLGINNPCAVTGKCAHCLGQSMCCYTVVTRASAVAGRMNVILVNEALGY